MNTSGSSQDKHYFSLCDWVYDAMGAKLKSMMYAMGNDLNRGIWQRVQRVGRCLATLLL